MIWFIAIAMIWFVVIVFVLALARAASETWPEEQQRDPEEESNARDLSSEL